MAEAIYNTRGLIEYARQVKDDLDLTHEVIGNALGLHKDSVARGLRIDGGKVGVAILVIEKYTKIKVENMYSLKTDVK